MLSGTIFGGQLKYLLYVSIFTGALAGVGTLLSVDDKIIEGCFLLMLLCNILLMLLIDSTYKVVFRDFWNVIFSIGFMLCVHSIIFAFAFVIFAGKGCQIGGGGPPRFMDA